MRTIRNVMRKFRIVPALRALRLLGLTRDLKIPKTSGGISKLQPVQLGSSVAL